MHHVAALAVSLFRAAAAQAAQAVQAASTRRGRDPMAWLPMARRRRRVAALELELGVRRIEEVPPCSLVGVAGVLLPCLAFSLPAPPHSKPDCGAKPFEYRVCWRDKGWTALPGPALAPPCWPWLGGACPQPVALLSSRAPVQATPARGARGPVLGQGCCKLEISLLPQWYLTSPPSVPVQELDRDILSDLSSPSRFPGSGMRQG